MFEMMLTKLPAKKGESFRLLPGANPYPESRLYDMNASYIGLMNIAGVVYLLPHNQTAYDLLVPYKWDPEAEAFTPVTGLTYPVQYRLRGSLVDINGKLGMRWSSSNDRWLQRESTRITDSTLVSLLSLLGSGSYSADILSAVAGGKQIFAAAGFNSKPVLCMFKGTPNSNYNNANITWDMLSNFTGASGNLGMYQWVVGQYAYFLMQGPLFYRVDLTTGTVVSIAAPSFSIDFRSGFGINMPVIGTRLYLVDRTGGISYFDTKTNLWVQLERPAIFSKTMGLMTAAPTSDGKLLVHPGQKANWMPMPDLYLYTPPT